MRKLLIFALLTLATPGLAEGVSPVRMAEISARLYAEGLAKADAILIITAAKLRKGLAPVAVDRAPEDGRTAEGAPLSWQEMLAAAEPLAAGDAALEGLILDVEVETSKGVASGPVYNIGALSKGDRDIYPPLEFRGGEYAEVYVEAKAATNINLTILDDQGRLVCSDTDVSHIAYCGWTPASGGTFVLRVENKGPAAADYALMTN